MFRCKPAVALRSIAVVVDNVGVFSVDPPINVLQCRDICYIKCVRLSCPSSFGEILPPF